MNSFIFLFPPVIKKRSLTEEKPFAEFAGKGTIEYFIENLAQLP